MRNQSFIQSLFMSGIGIDPNVSYRLLEIRNWFILQWTTTVGLTTIIA